MYRVHSLVLVFFWGEGGLDCEVLRAPQYLNPALAVSCNKPCVTETGRTVSTVLYFFVWQRDLSGNLVSWQCAPLIGFLRNRLYWLC